MKLQTTIPLYKVSPQINYQSNVLLLGSCFAEHVAAKLAYYKFQSLSNPFGNLFQPKAIENLVDRALSRRFYSEEEVFFLNDRWQCYDAHSDLSNTTSEATVDCLNDALESIRRRLMDDGDLNQTTVAKAKADKQINPPSLKLGRAGESTHFIFTLGTAWVYRHRKSGQLVANCHKVPQREFDKELLSPEEILKSITNICKLIHGVNKNATIIFTVSPVRHLKDGFIENMRSKAHLITAVSQLNEPNTHYFPSYEIMMDELRDYRYYAMDMVHPNELAVDYIWEKFRSIWIDENAYDIMDRVGQVQKGLEHRPFNPESEKHRKFLRDLEKKINALKADYPFMEF